VFAVIGLLRNLFANLLELFEGYRNKFGLSCLGYVLMPDHLHALVLQHDEGLLVPKLMEGFKSVSSRSLTIDHFPERKLWSDDVPVPGSDAVKTKLEYMHFNPVKRGLAATVQDYTWSSACDWFETGKGIVTVDRKI
jgi:putative transposase